MTTIWGFIHEADAVLRHTMASPVRFVLFALCVAPYLLALWAINLLGRQVEQRTGLSPTFGKDDTSERVHLLWGYEKTLATNGVGKAYKFAHLFGFTTSTTLGTCVMLFLAVPTRIDCGDASKMTGLAGVAITTSVAVAVASGLSLGAIFVRIANNDATARMFANSFKSLVATIIAGFSIAALTFVTGQNEVLNQSLGFVIVGSLVGIWGERALDYFTSTAAALIKAPVITPEKRADLNLIDGLTEEDIQRLAEESVDSLHALAFIPTPRLFFNTKYSLQRICDLQDQALLVKYVGADKARSFRTTLMIRGAMDLLFIGRSILSEEIEGTGNNLQHKIRLRVGQLPDQHPLSPAATPPAEETTETGVPEQPVSEQHEPVTAQAAVSAEPPVREGNFQLVTIADSEWQKMFNILGFNSVEQGKIALSNIVDDEVIQRLVVYYKAAPTADGSSPTK
jgi:hypothetical protein